MTRLSVILWEEGGELCYFAGGAVRVTSDHSGRPT